MKEDLLALQQAYPDRMSFQSIASTADGREVYEVIFGNPLAEKHIILQAGIHAREYMTSLLVMNQLEMYLAYYEEGSYRNTELSSLFDEVCVHVMPMMNPDGISISQYGLDGIQSSSLRAAIREWYERDKRNGITDDSLSDYLTLWKANANGVDLNRNFDYGFEEYGGAAAPGALKYKGTAALCERESAALVRRTEEISPVLAVSYHASGSVIYWDYGQTGQLRSECSTMVDVIHAVNGNEIKYAASDKQDAAGYGDWLVMVKGIPSATIEIGVGAAPLSISEYSRIWERNAMMWAALAIYAQD